MQAGSHTVPHIASRSPGGGHPKLTPIGGAEPARVFGFVVGDNSRNYYARYMYEVIEGKTFEGLPPNTAEAVVVYISHGALRLLPTYLGAARPSMSRVRNQLIPVYCDNGRLEDIFVLKDDVANYSTYSENDIDFVGIFSTSRMMFSRSGLRWLRSYGQGTHANNSYWRVQSPSGLFCIS